MLQVNQLDEIRLNVGILCLRYTIITRIVIALWLECWTPYRKDQGSTLGFSKEFVCAFIQFYYREEFNNFINRTARYIFNSMIDLSIL